jgi:hypothetical protein
MNTTSPEQLEQIFSPEKASKGRLAIIKDGLSLIENSAHAMGLDEVKNVSQNNLNKKKLRDIKKAFGVAPELSQGQAITAKVGESGGVQSGKENPHSNDNDTDDNNYIENVRAAVNAAYEK